ncbi:transposable element Tcb1 transposase [Trichonephila clavipes]|nr:transposable element Tcb1 transposase [Trichonephila clavipes]
MKVGSALVPVMVLCWSEGGQGNASNQTICGLDTLELYLESWYGDQFPIYDSRSTLVVIPNTLTPNLYVTQITGAIVAYESINSNFAFMPVFYTDSRPSKLQQRHEYPYRGRIVAYRDYCGLSFKEIGSRVGRNQTTVMRTCDRWMQAGTTDRRGRSHLPQCTTSLTHPSAIPRWSDSSLKTPWREDAEQLYYAPPHCPTPVIVVWVGIEYPSRTPQVRIACTLNSQHYISEVLEPVVLPYLQGLATTIFQQDNA